MLIIINAIVVLIVTLFVVYIIHFLRGIKRIRKLANEFSGRSYTSLVGDVLQLSSDREKLFKQLRENASMFPDSYRIISCHLAAFNLITASYVEVVLSSMKYIEKGMVYKFLHPWLNTGLLTSTGDKWHQRRKLLTPAFHFSVLRRFIPIFGEHSQRLIDELNEECEKTETNVVPLMSKYALNIICETAMGISLNSNDSEITDYRNAVYELGYLFSQRISKPWLFIDFIFMFTPWYWKQRKLLTILHNFTQKVIKEREHRYVENNSNIDKEVEEEEENVFYGKRRFAMLDLLISIKRKTGEIDEKGIQEEVDTFMFEGHDTVATALSFALLMLANHKDVQEKVIEEIDRVFANSNRTANYNDLQNMCYLDMCIKETLRLYPSVAYISRKAQEDVPLPCGKTIPASSLMHIHIYDLHRDSRMFPNPNVFNPDRFLPHVVKNRHPYAYVPFSAGPRNCIGQKFAMLELKSVISSILRYFRLQSIDKPTDLTMIIDIVLRTKNGIHVKFERRH